MANDDSDATARKKKLMAEALLGSMGNITKACEGAGISRQTHYQWKKEDAEYAEMVKDMPEIRLDYAESKLFKAMKADKLAAIIFFLKTQGKERGYIEKAEFDHSFQAGGGGIMFYIPDNGRDKKPEEKKESDESEEKTETQT